MRRELMSFLKIAGFFAIWAVGLTIVIMALVQLGGDAIDKNPSWKLAAEAGGVVAVVIALLVMALLVDKRPFSTLGLPFFGAAHGLIFGTIIGIVIFCVPLALLIVLGYATYAPAFSGFDPMLFGWLLLIMILNVIHQELLVRSYLFQEMWTKYSASAAVVFSTIVFVALHAQAIGQGVNGVIAAVNIALASIMLGLAYLRTEALWLPIGIHFGWNAVQGPFLGINVTGQALGGDWHAFLFEGPDLWTGGSMGVEGGLAGLAGPAFGILIVLAFPKRVRLPP
jgi:hypothetical protein